MELYVQYKEICTHSHREDKEWGEWSATYDFSIDSVSLTSKSRYETETFNVPFEAKAGDIVFVLSMIYSTGDTFGQSTGNGEVLWVFKDPDIAKAALAKWTLPENEEVYSIEFIVDDGTTRTMSNPSAGYFENRSDIDLRSFLVNL